MKTYTSTQLKNLIKKYLKTLDDKVDDEYYTTEQGVHEIGLLGFMEWVGITKNKRKP